MYVLIRWDIALLWDVVCNRFKTGIVSVSTLFIGNKIGIIFASNLLTQRMVIHFFHHLFGMSIGIIIT